MGWEGGNASERSVARERWFSCYVQVVSSTNPCALEPCLGGLFALRIKQKELQADWHTYRGHLLWSYWMVDQPAV